MGSAPVPRGCGQLTLTHPSPNFGPRRDAARPDIVVIHYTAMASADDACRTLCDPETEVSAHYLIDPNGRVRSLVPEDMRAWHAGAGAWGSVTDVNSRSIGIELSNDGFSPFAAPLMDALEGLLDGIIQRWAIRPERIIGHSDMAPGRKIDPGVRFDWHRLARQGMGVWPRGLSADVSVSPAQFRRDARAFGYPDVSDDLLLEAVRRRFRPAATGPLDRVDMQIIDDLATRFPVDAASPTA